MNTEQALNLVVPAIKNREPSPSGKWTLCWKQNTIICIRTTTAWRQKFPIMTINEQHILHGLSKDEWNFIKQKLEPILKRYKT